MVDETPAPDEIETPDDLVKVVLAFVRESLDHYREWRTEARDCYAFVSGDQWDEEDKLKLREQMRPVITFNRTGPVVDAISGWEVSNRQQVRYIPRTDGDAQVNEIYTGAADWIRDECDAEDEESDAFGDTVICGMGCTETRMDYQESEDGIPVVERVDIMEMRPDPKAKKRNLGDAKRVARVRDVDKDYFEARWPDKIDDVDVAGTSIAEQDDQAETPHDNDPKLWYTRTADAPPKKGTYRVIHYQWCQGKTAVRVLNPQTQQIEAITPDQFKVLKERIPAIKGVPITRYRYMECFVSNGVLLEAKEAPAQDGKFTYKFITGKRDRNNGTWYGMVRPMMDPQRWANKFFSTTLHHMNTAGKGIVAETDAFANPRKAEDSWAAADSIVWAKPGAVSAGKIMQKPFAPMPPGLEQLMQFTLGAFREVTGVNMELMGLVNRDQPGVLEYQRKQAGLTILATLFDSLRRYRKEQGRLLLEFIDKYVPENTLVRITVGSGMEKYVPLVKQPGVKKYDVVVDTSPTSPNQKESTWAILQPMLPAVMKMNPPPEIWPIILEASPLPESTVQKINEVLKAPRQPPPDPAMVKVQADIQGKQAELQMKREDMAMSSQLEAQKAQQQLEIERVKAEQQMQLEMARFQQETQIKREQAEIDLEIETRRANQQMAMANQKARQDAEIRKQSADTKNDGQRAKDGAAVALHLNDTSLGGVIGDHMTKQSDKLAEAIAELAKAARAKRRVKTPRGVYESEMVN